MAIAKDASLSLWISVGTLESRIPISWYKLLNQQTSRAASDIATYSASAEDSACDICHLELHVIAPSPAMNTYPEVDFPSSALAKAASEYP